MCLFTADFSVVDPFRLWLQKIRREIYSSARPWIVYAGQHQRNLLSLVGSSASTLLSASTAGHAHHAPRALRLVQLADRGVFSAALHVYRVPTPRSGPRVEALQRRDLAQLGRPQDPCCTGPLCPPPRSPLRLPAARRDRCSKQHATSSPRSIINSLAAAAPARFAPMVDARSHSRRDEPSGLLPPAWPVCRSWLCRRRVHAASAEPSDQGGCEIRCTRGSRRHERRYHRTSGRRLRGSR